MIQQSHSWAFIQRKTWSTCPNVYCSTVYNSQDLEATIDRGLDIKDMVHIYNGISFLFIPSVVSDSFANLWSISHQAPLSTGFPRQEYWSGLLSPSPEDLPDPEIKPNSPALQSDSLTLSHQGSPWWNITQLLKIKKYAICSNSDEPRDFHTQSSQTMKEKYHIILLVCRI